MLVSFNHLPDFSRVWVFQSSRELNNNEIKEIESKLDLFITNWTSHGKGLEAGFTTPYKRFIVIGLNENHQTASGCSIDSCVNFIKKLEGEYKIDLLDKMNVTYRDKKTINYITLSEFRLLIKNRKISRETIVFNNLVLNKEQFNDQWEVPIDSSWHNRFFK